MSMTRSRKMAWVAMALAVGLAFVAGLWLGGGRGDDHEGHGAAVAAETGEATIWTCSMHPQIRQPEPGDCPICGMDLIPLKGDDGTDLGPRELKLSASARALAQIRVEPVERRLVERRIRMVGAVTYDETRLTTITAWVGGRLDRLFVDYTGISVNKGDHMVMMYSPSILAAQEELLQAKQAVEKLQESPSRLVLESARATLEATRDKLRLWGLTAEQIAEVESRGSASDQIQINAPVGGIVVQKNAQEGEYVQTGTPIYRIADLSQVWVQLDAYESDLSWLRYGQEVEFTTEAYPGRTFMGRIAFIDPILTERTRTVKVRVNVPNEAGLLKPGMFTRATVAAKLASSGRVIDEELAGKWIGPMHPEIVRDEPGECPICGMPLKKAEELGYVSPAELEREVPLVIPATAPLITGKRAVVYLQNAEDPSRFEGREIVLGPRAGDFYIVMSGLQEGDLVVTNGAFKIDSALQLQAKPSMMSPSSADEAAEVEAFEVPAGVAVQLKGLFDGYLRMQQALAADNAAEAKAAAGAFREDLQAVDAAQLADNARAAWMKSHNVLQERATAMESGAEIEEVRGAFEGVSVEMIEVARRFGSGHDEELLVMHCPMAFDDKGADWLQLSPELANPYFGASMLRCGEIRERLAPRAEGETAEAETGFEGLPASFTASFSRLVDDYLTVQKALSDDDHEGAVAAARSLDEALQGVEMAELEEGAHMAWMTVSQELKQTTELVAAGEDIEASRKGFSLLSESLAEAVRRFGGELNRLILRAECPMAFNDRGAMWLQAEREIANPYFGSTMYGCGEITDELSTPVDSEGSK